MARVRTKAGFTLVEVLVVVGIAMLVTAMIFPVYRAMHRHQEFSTCALNLKSIGAALRMYRDDWEGFPPDVTEVYRHFDDHGTTRTVNGLGLYLLYHLYTNADVLEVGTVSRVGGVVTVTTAAPHYFASGDTVVLKYVPRGETAQSNFNGAFTVASVPSTTSFTFSLAGDDDQALHGYAWCPAKVRYSSEQGDYLRRVEFLHCPANPRRDPDWSGLYGNVFPNADGSWPPGYWPPAYLGDPANGGSYNGYDWYYRRDWEAEWARLFPTDDDPPVMGNRNLRQAYPPDNTVVTWCTAHRNVQPLNTEQGVTQDGGRGDYDLVLWVDGSVERMPSAARQFLSRKP